MEFKPGMEEEQMIRGKHNYPFSSTSNYKGFITLGNRSEKEEDKVFRSSELMIMPQQDQNDDNSNNSNNNREEVPIEKEHMFDKVVTPSDVGKLNRLVIPKQHAERYFPLDSTATEKGLLLNFEDRQGKTWRFRYSYWNSSQSYVITKGWSRFVKEKRLDAGDIVSFQRGLGESAKDRLFIDWRRRRPDHRVNSTARRESLVSMVNINHNLISVPHHHFSFQGSISWPNPNLPRVHTGSVITSYHPSGYGYGNSMFYGGGAGVGARAVVEEPVVFESVPVVQGKKKAEPKRLRLFGVNMECPMPESDECEIILSSTAKIQPAHLHHNHQIPSTSQPNQIPQFTLYNGMPLLETGLLYKGKPSMSFEFGS